ncbi:MAG: hypothetical protein OK474_00175 [Thaumarchaeota archaeon]|nr:hypothetical protein [Nitrososphaerota archaeon]
MKLVPVLLALVGVLLMLAGLVFILQGMGIVGPQSSFMFNNPTWIYQGVAVMVIGILSLAAGLFLSRKRR